MHVIFTADGIPAHLSADPRPGSEWVDGHDLDFLIAHRRLPKGKWVPRGPAEVPEPTEEEIAARRRADHAAAVAARDADLRAALAEDADPLFFKWQRGEVGKADWLAAVAEVRARFPKPELPEG